MSGGPAGPGGAGDPGDAVRGIVETVAAEDGPAVVGLLADSGAPEVSHELAERLCDAVAERRRSLVANLAGPGSGFDRVVGAGDGEGLEGVRTGRIDLSEAPVHVEGRRFLYLPAGRAEPGTGDEGRRPLDDEDVVEAVEKLARKIREAGGVLLAYVTPEALPDRRTAGLLDATVRLGDAPGVAGVTTLGRLPAGRRGPDETVEAFLGLPDDPEEGKSGPAEAAAPEPAGERGPEPAGEGEPESGEMREPEPAADDRPTGGGDPGPSPSVDAPPGSAPDAPPAPVPDAAPGPAGGAEEGAAAGSPAGGGAGTKDRIVLGAGDGDRDATGWRRHRRSTGVPWRRIALAAGLVAALAGGWWYLASRTIPEGAAGAPAAEEAGPTGGADGVDGDAGRAPAEAAAGDASGGRAGPGVVERSPELGWSVLVASYMSWEAARERLDRWSGEDAAPVLFAAPTPIGDRVYWRVFAGALADREEGLDLNGELVRRGWKEEAVGWEVRPASLAFRLSVEADRRTADGRVSELRDRGVPAYTLRAAVGGDTAWAVWAGAFESRDAAAGLGRSLGEQGIEAELTTRRGDTGDT